MTEPAFEETDHMQMDEHAVDGAAEEGDEMEVEKGRHVYLVSGGGGFSGENLLRTVLAQFEGLRVQSGFSENEAEPTPQEVRLHVVVHVKQCGDLVEVLNQAKSTHGIVVHTLVDHLLRAELERLGTQMQVATVDLMGPMLGMLSNQLEIQPSEIPGQYQKERTEYFRRLDAVEFAVALDDGKKPDRLKQAEIVLLGVSRAGKTPISMYLSTQGYRVANVALVDGIPPPEELFQVDPRRVIGLYCDDDVLLEYRKNRAKRIGLGDTNYTKYRFVAEEITYAISLYKQHKFWNVDTTHKSVEEVSEEIIKQIRRAFGKEEFLRVVKSPSATDISTLVSKFDALRRVRSETVKLSSLVISPASSGTATPRDLPPKAPALSSLSIKPSGGGMRRSSSAAAALGQTPDMEGTFTLGGLGMRREKKKNSLLVFDQEFPEGVPEELPDYYWDMQGGAPED